LIPENHRSSCDACRMTGRRHALREPYVSLMGNTVDQGLRVRAIGIMGYKLLHVDMVRMTVIKWQHGGVLIWILSNLHFWILAVHLRLHCFRRQEHRIAPPPPPPTPPHVELVGALGYRVTVRRYKAKRRNVSSLLGVRGAHGSVLRWALMARFVGVCKRYTLHGSILSQATMSAVQLQPISP